MRLATILCVVIFHKTDVRLHSDLLLSMSLALNFFREQHTLHYHSSRTHCCTSVPSSSFLFLWFRLITIWLYDVDVRVFFGSNICLRWLMKLVSSWIRAVSEILRPLCKIKKLGPTLEIKMIKNHYKNIFTRCSLTINLSRATFWICTNYWIFFLPALFIAIDWSKFQG
jgi:hypothetical protein